MWLNYFFRKIILNDGLKPGPNQFYAYHLNNNKLCRKVYCGNGVYFAPEINVAENYAEKFKLGGFKEDIKFVIMARVNPYRTREPDNCPNNWVLNATTKDIRQYRLLVKIVKWKCNCNQFLFFHLLLFFNFLDYIFFSKFIIL